MLTVHLPPGLATERRYVAEVVLGEFLGLPFQIADEPTPGTLRIEAEGKVLTVADLFFARESEHWLERKSFAATPPVCVNVEVGLKDVNLVSPDLPAIFSQAKSAGRLITCNDHEADCGLDLFGTIFFLLTRYEEALIGERDGHERIPLRALSPFQRDNLHRPLVDEYVEVLWALLTRLWPNLVRKQRQFRLLPTHDLDEPFRYAFLRVRRLLRRMAGDVVRRRSVGLALDTGLDWLAVRRGLLARDPCNQFGWMMEQSERRGLRSAFYFICNGPAGAMDADYPIDDSRVVQLMRTIAQRGHEVGLHGSYDSYDDGDRLVGELGRLKQVCRRAGVDQNEWGGRQHYLRWRTPQTICHWDRAGLDYDSSMTFAEQPGFRCGTCHEFPAFDLAGRRRLRVRERPLIVMESSVLDERYMGMGLTPAAVEVMLSLKRTCRRFAGDFVLLWHNSSLASPRERELYLSVLNG
jgi:hypothetical protein